MNIFRVTRYGAALAFCVMFQSAGAAGIHMCVDDAGNKTFQQHPCKKKESEKMIQPVSADRLSQDIIVQAVSRFDEAMTSRDVESVFRLLTMDFSYQTRNLASGDILADSDRQMYRARIGRLLPALTLYDAERLDPEITIREGEGRHRSRLREHLKFMDNEARGETYTDIELRIVGGQVKISRIIAYQNAQ